MANKSDTYNVQYGVPVTFRVIKPFFFRNEGMNDGPDYFTWIVEIRDDEGDIKEFRLNLPGEAQAHIVEELKVGGVATLTKMKVGKGTSWDCVIKKKGDGDEVTEFKPKGAKKETSPSRGKSSPTRSDGFDDDKSFKPSDIPGSYLESIFHAVLVAEHPAYLEIVERIKANWERHWSGMDGAMPFETYLARVMNVGASLFINGPKKGPQDPRFAILNAEEEESNPQEEEDDIL